MHTPFDYHFSKEALTLKIKLKKTEKIKSTQINHYHPNIYIDH